VDKDLGFNITGGGYSNELKQIVNCVKQNWDGSSFLVRFDQQEGILWSMGWYYGHPTRKAGDSSCISTVPVFTKEVQVGLLQENGHFNEATEEPPPIHSSQVTIGCSSTQF